MLNDLFAGIVSGCMYGVFGACICVLFRVSKVVNIAIGDLAAFATLAVAWLTTSHGLNVWVGILIVLAAFAVFSYAYDTLVTRPIAARSSKNFTAVMFFFTLALSLLVEGLGQLLFGSEVHGVPALWSGANFKIGSLVVERPAIVLIAVTLVATAAMGAFLRYTLIGRVITACGQNETGVRVVGVNPNRIRLLCFIGSVLAGAMLGILVSPLLGFTYSSGLSLGTLGLVAAAFARLVNPIRAVVVGILIGMAEALIGGYVTSQYQVVMVFGVLSVLILARPKILGTLGSFD
jgi:branched-subunit amino acid ABC-type transport system permease component